MLDYRHDNLREKPKYRIPLKIPPEKECCCDQIKPNEVCIWVELETVMKILEFIRTDINDFPFWEFVNLVEGEGMDLLIDYSN